MECYAAENCENPRKKPRREGTWSRAVAKKQRYVHYLPKIFLGYIGFIT